MTGQSHTWKPALAVRRTTLVADAAGLTLVRGRRERRIAFADIEAVRFIEIIARTSSCSLVLVAPGTKMILHCGVQLADTAHDANARAYAAACADALDALARARPDLEVSFGGGWGVRASLALLGLVLGLTGGGLAVLGLFGGELSELWLTAVVGALMAYSGIRMALSFNPFRAPQRVPAAQVALNLGALARGPEGS